VFLVFGHSIICQILILSLPSISYIRTWVHQTVIWLTQSSHDPEGYYFFQRTYLFCFFIFKYLYIFAILSFWVEIIVGMGMLCLNTMVVGFVFVVVMLLWRGVRYIVMFLFCT